MNKLVLPVLLLSLVFAACKKKKDDCNPNQYQYTYKNNAQVDTSRYAAGYPLVTVVNPGSKTVFTYTAYSSPCQITIDGGGGLMLVFEVDPAATSFNYFTSDLAAAKCYYRLLCVVCFPQDAFTPFSGTIEGTKVNGTQWNVHADLKLNNSSNAVLQFSGTFTAAR